MNIPSINTKNVDWEKLGFSVAIGVLAGALGVKYGDSLKAAVQRCAQSVFSPQKPEPYIGRLNSHNLNGRNVSAWTIADGGNNLFTATAVGVIELSWDDQSFRQRFTGLVNRNLSIPSWIKNTINSRFDELSRMQTLEGVYRRYFDDRDFMKIMISLLRYFAGEALNNLPDMDLPVDEMSLFSNEEITSDYTKEQAYVDMIGENEELCKSLGESYSPDDFKKLINLLKTKGSMQASSLCIRALWDKLSVDFELKSQNGQTLILPSHQAPYNAGVIVLDESGCKKLRL